MTPTDDSPYQCALDERKEGLLREKILETPGVVPIGVQGQALGPTSKNVEFCRY